MSDDVLITPASRKIELKDNSGNIDGKIELDSNGNLNITAPNGNIGIGDTTSDLYIGNGTDSVDMIFEQAGAIKATSGTNLTFGDTSHPTLIKGSSITVTGNTTISDKLTTNEIQETQFTHTAGTDNNFSPSDGTVHTWIAGSSVTTAQTFTYGSDWSHGQFIYLILYFSDSGVTITWPSTGWITGATPTLSSGTYHHIILWKAGTSTAVYGSLVQ